MYMIITKPTFQLQAIMEDNLIQLISILYLHQMVFWVMRIISIQQEEQIHTSNCLLLPVFILLCCNGTTTSILWENLIQLLMILTFTLLVTAELHYSE